MSEYTPSTKEIKQAYAEQCGRTWAYCDSGFPEHQREFDRWLAQHDAEMVARTLNAVSVYLYEADLLDAINEGRVSLIFNELTDDEWLDWLEDARLLIKKGN